MFAIISMNGTWLNSTWYRVPSSEHSVLVTVILRVVMYIVME